MWISAAKLGMTNLDCERNDELITMDLDGGAWGDNGPRDDRGLDEELGTTDLDDGARDDDGAQDDSGCDEEPSRDGTRD
ncbi:hypothetical protein KFK09_012017 [Dendrobium nobile]|uniref:Uncharacterized protein n=1 Tax=Dendrobium nobile TaxID=94219 RepID=A0A8T3BGN9_DENNO|nr:hypothetical protein KFK09_012017 [Dendrobium nobile]